jgi:NAD(P)-dependent dehydrogenase (short-subunit alcohol dehydrogenase family)
VSHLTSAGSTHDEERDLSRLGASLKGRRGLVTGAGSGIGLATALRLARMGVAVAVVDMRAEAVNAAVEIVRSQGGSAIGFVADVGEETQIAETISDAIQHLGGLDIVVASAGISRAAATHELSLDEWNTVIRVNLTGTFLAVKHALPALIESGHGSIVTIGSVASTVVAGGVTAYDASKGGVLQFTRAVAVEYVGDGVRANCVCPGVVATDLRLNTQALYGSQTSGRSGPEPATRLRIPMERRAHADEIASVVAFLCSDDASFITGAMIAADGGYTAI